MSKSRIIAALGVVGFMTITSVAMAKSGKQDCLTSVAKGVKELFKDIPADTVAPFASNTNHYVVNFDKLDIDGAIGQQFNSNSIDSKIFGYLSAKPSFKIRKNLKKAAYTWFAEQMFDLGYTLCAGSNTSSGCFSTKMELLANPEAKNNWWGAFYIKEPTAGKIDETVLKAKVKDMLEKYAADFAIHTCVGIVKPEKIK